MNRTACMTRVGHRYGNEKSARLVPSLVDASTASSYECSSENNILPSVREKVADSG